ncbi:thiol reductase thioredoxin [Geomonas limicola]|uniref:Thiol reductase thioredoxin n=1 Tax=Geomonas limicola TaxID=2740186 RepID=A0A6V8N8N4_9BACT|nr:thioredoxin family protein [Geomonas limicola]GFO68770.1 thiol reductase thioredoxin [Geomonas limicola]
MKLIVATMVATLLLTGISRAELPSASEATIQKALASGKPTVIDLGARTCIPCKKMAPVLESLSAEYRDRASVLFIDVHEGQTLADRFRIQMIPTQIFFNAQGKEVKRHVGFLEKSEIVKELKAAGLR